MSWTDERVETLKRMWNEGQSASQIAKELGGVTRNAVIGKVHRLGLSNRVGGPATPEPAPPVKPAAAPKAEAPRAEAPKAAPQPRSAEPSGVRASVAGSARPGPGPIAARRRSGTPLDTQVIYVI